MGFTWLSPDGEVGRGTGSGGKPRCDGARQGDSGAHRWCPRGGTTDRDPSWSECAGSPAPEVMRRLDVTRIVAADFDRPPGFIRRPWVVTGVRQSASSMQTPWASPDATRVSSFASRMGPTRRISRIHTAVHPSTQSRMMGQGHPRKQPSVGHQRVTVSGCMWAAPVV